MRLSVVAVGRKQPGWVNDAFADYARRMPRDLQIELIELKAETRSPSRAAASILEAERDRIRASVPGVAYLVVLDERGEQIDTVALSARLARWQERGADVALVIGGADGLHADIRNEARETLALSRLTIPHGLARVLLAEQLYRAWTLLAHHPYHRA